MSLFAYARKYNYIYACNLQTPIFCKYYVMAGTTQSHVER